MAKASPTQVERVGWYLRHITRCLDRDLAFLLSQEGLTFAQMVVLRQIRASQCTTLAQLTDQLKWAASTLSGIVKRLERDGLVERLPDRSDLRVFRLCVTAKAHRVLEATCCAYNQHLAAILSHFDGEEVLALIAGLEQLWEAVQKEQPHRKD